MRAALTIILCCLALSARAAAPLRLCFEDAPQAPWTMPDGTGLNFELLRRVAALTGERFEFVARPWKRCEEETRTGQVDGMIGAASSPLRRTFSQLPLHKDGSEDAAKALYQDSVAVFLRVGSGASWDGRRMVNPRGIVVAQRGYYVVDLLQQRGQKVQDTVKSAEEGLRMLAAGTADVAVLFGRAAEQQVGADPRFQSTIALAKEPFVTFSFHLAFGQQVYDKEPRRFAAIWNAVAAVRRSPDYRKLEAAQSRQSGAN